MRVTPLVLLLLLLPLVSGLCTKAQTEAYLADGTQFVTKEKQVDYAIVLDKSGSMIGEKLDKVKQAAKALVAQMPDTDRAAVISFHYEASLDQALTNDHAALNASIDSIKAGFGTKYLPPLYLVDQQFSTSNREKVIIFLSDGKSDYADSPEAILKLTDELSQQGICIMTISYALGGDESPMLVSMAETGKKHGCGEAFIASEKGSELEAVFSRIHQALSSTDLLSVDTKTTDDNYTVNVKSRLNGKSVPGSISDGCAETPAVTVSITKGKNQVAIFNNTTGNFTLLPGLYNYKSTALLTCGGSCAFIGTDTGQFTIGDVCSPPYQDLATYVTGAAQDIQITSRVFTPSNISGSQGTLVVWHNRDTQPRRIKSEYFDKIIPAGGNFTYVIENNGAMQYTDPDSGAIGIVKPLFGAGIDVLMIVDESGSMKGAGLAEAQQASQQFFSLLSPTDRGALITFSEAAFLLQDFTSDKDILHAATLKLQPEGSTMYLSALNLAQTVMPKQQGLIMFMSDGVPTDPEGEKSILAATEQLRKQGWCFMTIGFGEEGIAAKSLLNRMSGDSDCSGFFSASSGQLTETFGTIYQLSHNQEDLIFTDLQVPLITFSPLVHVSTKVATSTGKSIPSEAGVCIGPAIVQARTISSAIILPYNDTYSGTLTVPLGISKVSLFASISAQDIPSRAFTGKASRTVILLPLVVLPILLFLVIFAAMLIYLVKRRRA